MSAGRFRPTPRRQRHLQLAAIVRRRTRRPYFWIRRHGGMATIRHRWGCALLILLVLGTTTLAIALSSRPPARRLIEGIVVAFLWWLAVRALLEDPPPGMAPYFDRQIGDIHTYPRGKAIAARCPELDRIAEASGVHPISFFGFADDFHGEPVTWHDVADGLSTFTAVRSRVAAHEPEGSELLQDLDFVIDALQKAGAKAARFCLIITAAYSNAMEHEQRKGSFF